MNIVIPPQKKYDFWTKSKALTKVLENLTKHKAGRLYIWGGGSLVR